MRKIWILLICLCLLLCGCSFSGERIKEPVNFYYPLKALQYHTDSGVISMESREAAGHRNNLSYLLALYRMGPSSEDLQLPFPQGTAILMMEHTDTHIHLALGDTTASMSDTEFALACACLTLTCTELTDVSEVTVTNGQRTITMTRESVILMDSSMVNSPEES